MVIRAHQFDSGLIRAFLLFSLVMAASAAQRVRGRGGGPGGPQAGLRSPSRPPRLAWAAGAWSAMWSCCPAGTKQRGRGRAGAGERSSSCVHAALPAGDWRCQVLCPSTLAHREHARAKESAPHLLLRQLGGAAPTLQALVEQLCFPGGDGARAANSRSSVLK